ncbi:hypothetical protein [Actinoplanes sp. NBRC 103695]|uniref:hypothetical protein n=1 Tax=Actinoplanes sp. NBRC 103695 TaxID=3032202 RepID=UPI0024A49C41|nr:hypothetical protein [Actinoplanes sp. NBRC 103695]GLY95285.1 hypothetical protein Acsp02_25400 [Actinoplanes sp. NBRC 103695]
MDGIGYRGVSDVVEEDERADSWWDYPVYLTDREAETPWHEVASKIRSLRDLTEDEPGLTRAHETAVHLDGMIGAARRDLDTADVLPLLVAARYFAEEADEAADLPELLRRETGELAALLGARLGEAVRADREATPLWLDAAPAVHSRINVAGEIRTLDHHHVRRVTLDCESLHRDGPALEAFVAVLVDPSEENIAALRERLREIVREDRQRLPARVETHSSTAGYHIRETVVPLADLLHHRPGLVEALAEEYVHGVSPAAVLAALDEVADLRILRHAHGSGAVRAGLAAAVMIGYGIRITASTTVDAGGLARFDETVRSQVNATFTDHR